MRISDTGVVDSHKGVELTCKLKDTLLKMDLVSDL